MQYNFTIAEGLCCHYTSCQPQRKHSSENSEKSVSTDLQINMVYIRDDSEMQDYSFVRDFKNKLLELGKARLRELLSLRFADAEKVIALCVRQLKYGELSCESLSKKLQNIPDDTKAQEKLLHEMALRISDRVVTAGYVQDCERIAQYLCNVEEQQEIRNYYWQQYSGHTEKVARAVMIRRHGVQEAETRLPGVQNTVEEQVFEQKSFKKLAGQYEPQKGMTFDKFIKRAILWRILDVPSVPGADSLELDCTVSSQSELSSGDEQDEVRIRHAIDECLSRLRQCTNSQNKVLGIEQCAAFELRYKVYLDPTDMSSEELRQEYHGAQQRLKERETKLQEVEHNWKKTRANVLSCELELDILSYSTDQIDRLRDEALQRTLENMREEVKVSRKSNLSDERLKELDYMISYHRYNTALKSLEQARRDYESELKRSEKEIGKLIDLSQATVSRRLTSAKEFLQKCLRTGGNTGNIG